MIQANLHGKIPSSLQNSEDFLTSTVFGMLEYLSHSELLFKVMSDGMNLNRESLNLSFGPRVVVRYFFWPRLASCEPDLLIVVEANKEKHLFGIEAKYFSDKSSTEDDTVDLDKRSNTQRDQLAREIEDLYVPSTYRYLAIEEADIKSRTMIYITFENDLPVDGLEQSLVSVKVHNKCSFDKSQLYWLSWKSIYLRLIESNSGNLQDRRMITDLVRFFEKRNLKGYTGFKKFVPTDRLQWKLEQVAESRLNWRLGAVP